MMSVTAETTLFLIFLLVGIIIGLLFDIFRILRKSFKTPDFITYIEDIGFGILAGVILIFSIIVVNNGELRLFILLGIALGAILYFLTLSKLIIKVSVTILKVIINIVSQILKIIFSPIGFIFKRVKIIYIKIQKTQKILKIK